jgi:hypothetical protein
MTIDELAAYISTHLQQLGIDVVLSGGVCVHTPSLLASTTRTMR